MKRFLITYDLHNRRVYTGLYQLLATWKAVKLSESNWLVVLNNTTSANVVLNHVKATLDNDDTIAVLEIKAGSDWATIRVSAAANAWLSTNVTPAQKAA